jgi:predicted ATPase
MTSKSLWCVVTGGPASGKKTTLGLIKRMGYTVLSQVAREVIDKGMGKGKTIEKIRGDEAAFQLSLLSPKLNRERELPRSQCIFLNTALPDSVAYLRNCGGDPNEALKLCERNLYWKVFLLDQPSQFVKDYARTEDIQTAQRLNRLIREVYEYLGYEVISVPLMSRVEKRAEFITSCLIERLGNRR